MGRPFLPNDERRDDTLRIRLNVAERELIESAASESGEKLTTWCRSSLLKLAQQAQVGLRDGNAGRQLVTASAETQTFDVPLVVSVSVQCSSVESSQAER